MKKKSKNKCDFCNKKYGLITFICRCGGKFCTIHRYTDSHNCDFDYVSYERDKIKKNNPVVIKDKVPNRI